MINKIILKKLIYIFIFQILFINHSFSEIIKQFNIIGNDRVTDETVIMFSNLEVGDEINDDILNNSLKNIYLTDYFKSVSASNKNGIVEFKASFIDKNGKLQIHHERSNFLKEEENWFYVDGIINPQEVDITKKVSRNDPCPCGSGKKYKKCHAL